MVSTRISSFVGPGTFSFWANNSSVLGAVRVQAVQHALQPALELAAVDKAGERVVARLIGQPLGERVRLGDIAEHQHRADDAPGLAQRRGRVLGGETATGGGQNRQWDGIWTAKVRRSEIGWTAEIEIPFQTLNFDPQADTWGINFQRTVRRRIEESLWTGYPRNQGLRRMNNAGLLKGIRDVSQGHGIDVKPYVTGTAFSAPGRGQPYRLSGRPRAGPLLHSHAQLARQPFDQHGFCADRSGPASGQPHPLFSFLSGAALILPGGRQLFQFQSTTEGSVGFGGIGGTGVRLRPYFAPDRNQCQR